jgi:hypothetical protein
MIDGLLMDFVDYVFEGCCLGHGNVPFDYLLGSVDLAWADKMSSMTFSKHSAQIVWLTWLPRWIDGAHSVFLGWK